MAPDFSKEIQGKTQKHVSAYQTNGALDYTTAKTSEVPKFIYHQSCKFLGKLREISTLALLCY
jgi:hypothetical protein